MARVGARDDLPYLLVVVLVGPQDRRGNKWHGRRATGRDVVIHVHSPISGLRQGTTRAASMSAPNHRDERNETRKHMGLPEASNGAPGDPFHRRAPTVQ